MALSDKKILQSERNAVYVKSNQGRRLTGTVEQNKDAFDKFPQLLMDKYNALIDLLTSLGLDSIATDLESRYTKTETDAKISTETNDLIETIQYTKADGKFKITTKSGTSTTIDTDLEKIPASFELIESDGKTYLRITNQDGSYTQTDVTSLLNVYTFNDSDTVDFTEATKYSVTAVIKPNSITIDHLSLAAVSTLEGYVSAAAGSATAAAGSATAAETSANNASAFNQSAKGYSESASASKDAAASSATSAGNAATTANQKATAANNSAILSQSYAKGGTGTREGEDTDNAKYYKEEASVSKTAAESAKKAAETANTSAQGAKTAAQAAAQSAEAAKQSAQSSAASAATDAQRAEDAVAHNPTVQNGIWYVWNPETGSYASTGVPATGEMTVEVTYQQGDSATTPPTGAWQSSPPEVAQGKYLWTKTLFSDGTIGYSVARQGMDGEGAVISVNGKSGEVTITTDDVEEGTKDKYVTAAEKDKIANLPDDTNTAIAGKIAKVSPATAGNIPTLTADGQLVDSGKKADDLGGTFIVTLTSSGTSYTADKTFTEIKAANDAGNSVKCKYGTKIYDLVNIQSAQANIAIFTFISTTLSECVRCTNDNWTVATYSLVQQTRKINNKALSSDITLTASDVGAAPKPTTITGTLTAGSTSLVLSNSAITTDSTIDIYTDKWGVNPTDVVVETGKVTLTFEAQATALNVKVEVK